MMITSIQRKKEQHHMLVQEVESALQLHWNQKQQMLLSVLIQDGSRLSLIKNYSTGEIPFKWGKYPGRYKSDIYYVSSDGPSNYIGKIQIPGDPFTYDLFGNKIKVVSAPYTKRHLIGKMIAKSDIPEKYLPSYKKPEEKNSISY